MVTPTLLQGGYPDGPIAGETAMDRRAALNEFLAGVERRALRIAQLTVGDRDAAFDVVQDAMLSLVRHYADSDPAEWPPLFHRILANCARDRLRRLRVRHRLMAWLEPRDDGPADPLSELPDATAERPERILQRERAMAALENALRTLPDRQREAFLWRSIEELDVAATAAVMGCSEGSVKTHYFRAVRQLRAVLGDHWGD